tara:strand:+ start:1769 stop:2203 length:435 start_codon:yes stop_codon:yes gene_type:complete
MNKHLSDKIDIHLGILAKSKSLEHHCNNCGDCCRPSVKVTGQQKEAKVLVKGLTCKYLQKSDNKCSVYKKRHEKAPWCVDLKSMIVKGLAPIDCPYVKSLNGYQPTLRLSDDLHKSIIPLLRLAISRGPKEPYQDSELKRFLDA